MCQKADRIRAGVFQIDIQTYSLGPIYTRKESTVRLVVMMKSIAALFVVLVHATVIQSYLESLQEILIALTVFNIDAKVLV